MWGKSDDDHQTEIDVEDIEPEIGATRYTLTLVHTICFLLLLIVAYAKHTERNVERHMILKEDTDTRAEIETRHCGQSAGIEKFVVVVPLEI